MQINEEIKDKILNILLEYPNGISEFDLMKILTNLNIIDKNFTNSNMDLFHVHFLLFHALYQLKKDLSVANRFHLEINCLKIILTKIDPKELNSLSDPDPLYNYYMNINNLNINESELDNMLNNFWNNYNSFINRKKALDILGLFDPVDQITIKKRYRELVKMHHPDKGGDHKMIVLINEAIKTLKYS